MIELRFLRRLLPTIDETGQVVNYRHGEDVLQYRNNDEEWIDVPVVVEITHDP